MRIGVIFAGTALIAFLPAFQLSAQSTDRQVAARVVLGADARPVSIDPRWSSDLAARAGYLLDPNTLAYVHGGYADARIETGASALISSESQYRDRWTLGAGIERKILKRISARLEYRYSDLGEGDGAFDRHRLLAGVAYRF